MAIPVMMGRGGIRGWDATRRDIVRLLKEDPERLVTTLVDYYGLPKSGPRAWPGRAEAGAMPFLRKARAVEDALREDVVKTMGTDFNPRRFIPYVMMHEFEGILFSHCRDFAAAINRPDLASQFQAIRDQFQTPEEINDSSDTAPSKRIQKLAPNYQKPLFGVRAVQRIGLPAIRAACPHFNAWVSQLENSVHLHAPR
jgi:hypothetical protein